MGAFSVALPRIRLAVTIALGVTTTLAVAPSSILLIVVVILGILPWRTVFNLIEGLVNGTHFLSSLGIVP